jgi:hypothetical protein
MEYLSGIDVHFGHGLSLELATESDEVDQTLEEISALLSVILLEGFSETLWMKKGQIVQSEAVLTYSGSSHTFRTRSIIRRGGSTTTSVFHAPWTPRAS